MTNPTITVIDIETTGLNPGLHQITEIAWAHGRDGEVKELFLPHTLENADPKALEITHYYERGIDDPSKWCSPEDILALKNELKRNTICGSNVRFDALRMSLIFGADGTLAGAQEPWAYRLIDISNAAMILFDWETPRGLADVTKELTQVYGYTIAVPDHSAKQDVQCSRDAYYALRDLRSKMKFPASS